MEASGVELEHLVRHPVQEHPVVGHHDQTAVKVPQIVLEPFNRRQVEVIRGLVEEQQRRVREQQRRQRGAHAPAARELGQGPVLVDAREPQTREHASRLGLQGVLALETQVMLQLAGALEQLGQARVVRAARGQAPVEVVQLVAHRAHFAMRLERALQDRPIEPLGGLLREMPEPGAAGQHSRTGLGRDLPQGHPDQGGLAGPVGADQGAPVAGCERPAKLVEEHPWADRAPHVA